MNTPIAALQIQHNRKGNMVLRWLDSDGAEITFQYVKLPAHREVTIPLGADGLPAAGARVPK